MALFDYEDLYCQVRVKRIYRHTPDSRTNFSTNLQQLCYGLFPGYEEKYRVD